MIGRLKWQSSAQLVVVLLCALALKHFYSTASPNQLRWILAPTTLLVQLLSGVRFNFESNAGYMSVDRTFLIAASCAGVNFLTASFLMLSLRRLWKDRSTNTAWGFIGTSAALAFVATIIANTIRISLALYLPRLSREIEWLTHSQLHRLEGIFVYFGVLLVLYVVTEEANTDKTSGLLRLTFFPLLIYYAIAVGLPLVNGAFRQGNVFWEHSGFVLLIPLLMFVTFGFLWKFRRLIGKW